MQSTYNFSKDKYDIVNKTTFIEKHDYYRIKKVLEFIGVNKKVLDVGCYDGSISIIIKNQGNIVYGVDASKSAIEIARRKGIYAKIGDIEQKIPFKSHSMDIIFLGECIEHIYDTDKVIDECKRCLNNNGKLIITTPNVVSLPRRILHFFGNARYFEASLSFSTETKTVGHIRFFDKKLLVAYMNYKGFSLEEFSSDIVNFPSGVKSVMLAKIYPGFGRTLITSFVKND